MTLGRVPRRVLMICYYFPPLGGIASVRALKFTTYLREFGWDAIVLTVADGAYHSDPQLSPPEAGVVRTRSFELSRFGKHVVGVSTGDTKPAKVGALLAAARRIAHRWLYCPDAHIGWYPFAVSAARHAVLREKIDVVFSTSPPVTTHLIARRLHRDTGVPWVAEFRDPWTDAATYDSRWRRGVDEKLERSILEEASAIVTVSPTWTDLFRQRGARLAFAIPNGFDPSDFPSGSVASREPTAVYLGSYYPGLQDLETALRALARLRRAELPQLRLRFVGPPTPEVDSLIRREKLEDVTEWTGFVPHRHALRHLCGAWLLLLAGPTGDNVRLRGHIPAKVFEYLGTSRPILYTGHLGSDVACLLSSVPGARTVALGDVDGACRAIRELLADRGSARAVAPFTRRALTRTLADVLSRVSA